MRTARIIYITAWVIPIILAVLYLCGVIKNAEQQAGEATRYTLSLVTVVLTLGTTYISLRLFHFRGVRKWLEMEKKVEALCIAREVAILVVCLLDLATYYVHQTDSSLYLAGIMLVTLIFCYPENQ